jgi:hypothetical protein
MGVVLSAMVERKGRKHVNVAQERDAQYLRNWGVENMLVLSSF